LGLCNLSIHLPASVSQSVVPDPQDLHSRAPRIPSALAPFSQNTDTVHSSFFSSTRRQPSRQASLNCNPARVSVRLCFKLRCVLPFLDLLRGRNWKLSSDLGLSISSPVYGCAPLTTNAGICSTGYGCQLLVLHTSLLPPPPAGSWLPSHGSPPVLLVPGGGGVLLPGAARAPGARCYWYGQSFSLVPPKLYILSFQFSLRIPMVFQAWLVRHRAAGIAGSPTSLGSMAHIRRYRYLLPPTLTNFGRRVFCFFLFSLRAHE
jgi:hypothetical protein